MASKQSLNGESYGACCTKLNFTEIKFENEWIEVEKDIDFSKLEKALPNMIKVELERRGYSVIFSNTFILTLLRKYYLIFMLQNNNFKRIINTIKFSNKEIYSCHK